MPTTIYPGAWNNPDAEQRERPDGNPRGNGGFRKVLSMPNVSVNYEIMIFVGIIVVCSLLTVLIYNHRIKKPTLLIPQAFENVND